jgi:glycerate dehydrogenase
MKIICLDGFTLNPGDLSWDGFARLGSFVCHDRTPADQIVARAASADAVLTNKTPLSAATLDQLPQLRYIGVLATGYNVVDIGAAKKQRIVVTNVPTYSTDSVAQLVFALLLELCHRVGLHSEQVNRGEWSRSIDFTFRSSPLIELAGKTIGIVGLGRIGRRVAELAGAFGMKVIFAEDRPVTDGPANARQVPLDELFRQANVVSLHVPLTEATKNLVNASRLAMMKPNAFLINTSRGPAVDEPALRAALLAGQLAGAGLDVLSVEPPPANHPLIGLDNCIITPHIAWSTSEARRRLMAVAAENLAAFIAGRAVNVVNP